jgi:hypothetical protein
MTPKPTLEPVIMNMVKAEENTGLSPLRKEFTQLPQMANTLLTIEIMMKLMKPKLNKVVTKVLNEDAYKVLTQDT